MKNWKYIEGAKTGNADLSTISKNWSKTEIDHILQNAHVFKKEVVEEAKRLKEAEKNKTGNDTPWEYAHRKPKVINDDKTGAEEFFKKLSDDVKEREDKDDADIEKVGNATPNYRYKDFLITNPEGHEYIVFLKDGRTVGYRGTTSKAQAEDWCDWHDPKTGKSIGNKVGNMLLKVQAVEVGKPWGIYYDTEAEEFYTDYKGSIYDNPGFRTKEEAINYVKKRMKVGNSAQDDKFAYVMREFDEGKLKTPDGKVVTDPAQAKAIAYSESKKTENGLARARNAMAGNASSITYDDFLRKLENAINQGRDSVSFQMYGISNQTVETWAKKAKKEGYSQYIRDVRGAEVNLND